MVSREHQQTKIEAVPRSNQNNHNFASAIDNVNNNEVEKVHASIGTLSDNDEAKNFVTCHHYVGNSGKSSSPAHWHKEIEIMHFTEGKGFNHICQCKSDTFDAPAIVIVPSNLIHRTCYPPHCKVNRTLFSSECIRLHESDSALEDSLKFLSGTANKGSIVLRANDPGFDKLSSLLKLLEDLSDNPESNTYDPAKAQNDSIEQDRVDAFVAATFANIGSEQDRIAQLSALNRTNENNVSSKREKAINAGSIAIAVAQNYSTKESHHSSSKSSKDKKSEAVNMAKLRNSGLTLQFKGFLVNILGVLYEYGYFLESNISRRQRLARSNDIKIKELLKFIHDNYNNQMNISELASRLGVTNQYFCRFFKQLTDMSFIDYLNDLRLQKAAIEIASTEQSIREISSRHGFDTIGYFFKLFREHYETTPLGYRAKFINTPISNKMSENCDLDTLKDVTDSIVIDASNLDDIEDDADL